MASASTRSIIIIIITSSVSTASAAATTTTGPELFQKGDVTVYPYLRQLGTHDNQATARSRNYLFIFVKIMILIGSTPPPKYEKVHERKNVNE